MVGGGGRGLYYKSVRVFTLRYLLMFISSIYINTTIAMSIAINIDITVFTNNAITIIVIIIIIVITNIVVLINKIIIVITIIVIIIANAIITTINKISGNRPSIFSLTSTNIDIIIVNNFLSIITKTNNVRDVGKYILFTAC